MNNILKVSLIVVVVLALAGGLFFAGTAFGSFWLQRRADVGAPPVLSQGGGNVQPPAQGFGGPGQDGPNNPGFGGGDERGGRGQGGPDRGDGRGNPGRMGGGPSGGGPGGGSPDRGSPGGDPGFGGGVGPGGNGQANVTPPTEDEAKKAAEDYIASLKLEGLEVAQVLISDRAAYVAVKESATGNGAFELIVDPINKTAHPAMGPASEWNLKYGGVLHENMPQRGPKGQGVQATPTPNPDATAAPAATPADVSADMPLSEADALKAAQTFLDEHAKAEGATLGTTALKFYGYYSIDILKDSAVIGKLSVNGYNGLVAGHVLHK